MPQQGEGCMFALMNMQIRGGEANAGTLPQSWELSNPRVTEEDSEGV